MMEDELFDVVDENNEVIGTATRKKCHEKGLIHRSVMFFIFDESGKVLVTKRTRNKDFFPGYWSIVLGGHVLCGETYEEAAVREIEEETGIVQKPFKIHEFQKRIPEEKENVRVFGVTAQGELKLNNEEIKVGNFYEFSELEKMMKEHDFLPETEVLFPVLQGYLSSLSLQNL